MTVFATQATYQALKDLVGDRCWHLVAEESPKKTPYIVFTDISGERLQLMNGYSGHNQVRMQVSVFGKDSDELKRLEDRIIVAMESSVCMSASVDSSAASYDPDTRLRRMDLDFMCWEQTR